MVVKPEIKSFLIADMVIQEKGSNKWSAIGIFDRISAHQFPFCHPGIGLYARFTDAQGDYHIRIEFCDTDGRKLAFFEGIKISVPSQLMTPDFGIQIHNLVIPKPGQYDFNLFFNGEFVKNFPLIVEQIANKQ